MSSKFQQLLFFVKFWYVYVLVKTKSLFIKQSTRTNKNTILYLENFPIENAGYQYRAMKWAELLQKKGYKVDVWTLIEDRQEFETKIKQKPFVRFLAFSLKLRLKQILASRNYETVIVRRELLWYNDYGNLFMDKLLLKIHPNAILDFDDDIAAAKGQPRPAKSLFAKMLKMNGNKFNDSLRMYNRFIVASTYLKEKILQENPNVSSDQISVIPTCVDYDKYPPKVYPEKVDKLTFGWIGSVNNYPQLDLLIPTLNKLSSDYSFRLLVIGGKEYNPQVNFDLVYKPWTLKDEIQNLYLIDVGLMPLEENAQTKGKGGFKLLQYMGLGIVSVASAVSINEEILDCEECGFLARSKEEWEKILSEILKQKIDLSTYGANARKRIEKHFTTNSAFSKYETFLKAKI